MVTTRRSILTMRSTTGMRMIRPGPLAPSSLPSRKMTPRSYSRRMRMACGRIMAARMMIGTVQALRRNNVATRSSIMFSGCLLFSGFRWVLRFDLQSQAGDADNLHRVARFDGHFAHGIPGFPLDEDLAAGRIDARQGGDRLAQHGFAAGAHGQQLRPQARAYYEEEEGRGYQRGGDDVQQREPKGGLLPVKEHQRAQNESNDAEKRQHTVRGGIDVPDKQDHGQADQCEAGEVNW